MATLVSSLGHTGYVNDSRFIGSLGCLSDSNVSCTEAYGSVRGIFENWPNFYTCSWYPSLTKALDESIQSGKWVESVQSLATKGIHGGQPVLSVNISTAVANCLADYCQWSSDCRRWDYENSCLRENLMISNASVPTLNRSNAVTCLRNGVCGSTADVNPDIGGLGVILSFLIQYIISLFGVILHIIFRARYYFSVKNSQKNKGLGNLEDTQLPEERRLDHHLQALTSALVDFHKAQCFFSATVQIASLAVWPTFFDQSRDKDTILLKLSSANAVSPIVLTLAHIDFLGRRNSWYLFILSGISFILGSLNYWFLTDPELAAYYKPEVEILSCGNVAPTGPCFNQNGYYTQGIWKYDRAQLFRPSDRTQRTVWGISLAILCCRLIARVYKTGTSMELRASKSAIFQWFQARFTDFLSSKFWQVSKLLWRAAPLPAPVSSLFQKPYDALAKREIWDYVQIFFGVVALITQMASIIQVISTSLGMIETGMTFGQIVAVGIWIPVFIEYGYFEICKSHKNVYSEVGLTSLLDGAAGGMEYRLRTPLMVTEPAPEGEYITTPQSD